MIRFLPLLLLIVGCQRHGEWAYQDIPAKEMGHCTRLLHSSKDPSGGIDIEILQHGQILTTYLQVHFGLIPPSQENPEKAHLLLSSLGNTTSLLVDFHEGRQRVRLSTSQATLLISLLEKGEPVTLQLKGYREVVHSPAFEKLSQKLQAPPYKIPFHLPI